jgi:hypothetical protein
MVNSRIIEMAKTQIVTPDGLTIKVEGTPEEIAALVEKLGNSKKPTPKPSQTRKHQRKRMQRVQLVDLIDSLIDGGFFKTPRDLAAVISALAEMGHHYPVTTLSGAMLRKVRNHSLRRLKQNKRWVYTGSNK